MRDGDCVISGGETAMERIILWIQICARQPAVGGDLIEESRKAFSGKGKRESTKETRDSELLRESYELRCAHPPRKCITVTAKFSTAARLHSSFATCFAAGQYTIVDRKAASNYLREF